MSDYTRQFARNVLESLVLAAVVIIPLFANVYGALPFEESKTNLLKSIAILTLPFLVFLWFTEHRSEDKRVETESGWGSPLAGPVLIVGYASLVSTVFSVSPAVSFFGGYLRGQGTYTTLCYLLFFFSVARTIRTQKQIYRLLFAGALSGFSASTWAILQRLGVGPNLGAGADGRVWSTLGNPIFLSAFLIMTIPLQVYLAGLSWNAFRECRIRGTSRKEGLVYLMFLGLMLVFFSATLTAIILTQSRGPLLGLVAAVCLFLVVQALRKGQARMAAVCLVGSSILFLFFLFLSLLSSHLALFSDAPFLDPLRNAFTSSTGLVRLYIWEGVVALLSSNPLRILTGYGPETLSLVISAHIPPMLQYIESPTGIADRAHNEILDLLAMQGVLGLVAYLLLFGAVIRFILRELGLIRSRRHDVALVGWFLAGGLVGWLAPYAAFGNASYSGLGLGLGFIGGLFCYFFSYSKTIRRGGFCFRHPNGFLLSLLLAALVGHFVEVLFCFGTTSTRLYLWVLAAVALAAGKSSRTRPAPENPDRLTSLLSSSVVMGAGVVLFVLSTITFHYLGFAEIRPSFLSMVLGFHAFIILFCGPFLLVQLKCEVFQLSHRLHGLFVYLVLAVVLDGFYLLSHTVFEIQFARQLFGFLQEAILPVLEKTTKLISFYGWVMGLVFLVSLLPLVADRHSAKRKVISMTALMFAASMLLVLPVIISPNLKGAVADIYTRAGEELLGTEHWDVTAFCFKKAVSLEPGQAWRHYNLGHLYYARAKEALEPEKDKLFQESMFHVSKATHLAPLDVTLKNNLARISSVWAAGATDGKSRFHRLQVTQTFYAEALRADPKNTFLWKESAQIAADLGKLDQAVVHLQRALALHPNDFEAHRNLALMYRSLRNYPQALGEAESALKYAPSHERQGIENLVADLRRNNSLVKEQD